MHASSHFQCIYCQRQRNGGGGIREVTGALTPLLWKQKGLSRSASACHCPPTPTPSLSLSPPPTPQNYLYTVNSLLADAPNSGLARYSGHGSMHRLIFPLLLLYKKKLPSNGLSNFRTADTSGWTGNTKQCAIASWITAGGRGITTFTHFIHKVGKGRRWIASACIANGLAATTLSEEATGIMYWSSGRCSWKLSSHVGMLSKLPVRKK